MSAFFIYMSKIFHSWFPAFYNIYMKSITTLLKLWKGFALLTTEWNAGAVFNFLPNWQFILNSARPAPCYWFCLWFFIDRISRRSWMVRTVKGHKGRYLLFADNVVLLTSGHDLPHTLTNVHSWFWSRWDEILFFLFHLRLWFVIRKKGGLVFSGQECLSARSLSFLVFNSQMESNIKRRLQASTVKIRALLLSVLVTKKPTFWFKSLSIGGHTTNTPSSLWSMVVAASGPVGFDWEFLCHFPERAGECHWGSECLGS